MARLPDLDGREMSHSLVTWVRVGMFRWANDAIDVWMSLMIFGVGAGGARSSRAAAEVRGFRF